MRKTNTGKTNNGKSGIIKAAAIAVACALSVGGALAYFSATTDTKKNTFSIVAGEKDQTSGGSRGEIVEEEWDRNSSDPKFARDMQPGQTVTKDPKLKNTADYEAWGFIEVTVPVISAKMDSDLSEQPYEVVKLGDAGAGWRLIKSIESGEAGTPSKYVYAYETKLASGSTTGTAAFSEFTVQDFTYVSTETAGKEYEIGVTGRLIQTVGYADADAAAQALGLKDAD